MQAECVCVFIWAPHQRRRQLCCGPKEWLFWPVLSHHLKSGQERTLSDGQLTAVLAVWDPTFAWCT